MKKRYSKNLIISLLVFLVVINIFGMLWLGNLGGEIMSLEKEIDDQKGNGQRINDQFIKYGGLAELKKKAEELGYFHPETIIYSQQAEDVSLAK